MAKAWRNDAVSKVTGSAKYADDLKFHDMVYCVPVYPKKYIHAEISSISGIDEALKIKGVLRIITADDVPGSSVSGQIYRDYPMLASGFIRSEGDVIALAVAETRSAAVAAAELIDAEGTGLPAVFDPEEAMKEGAVLVHRHKGSNIINHHKIRRGADIDGALAECDTVIERQYATSHVEHAYLEPESAVCLKRPDGVIEVYGGMQHPFSTRRFVSALLGLPLADVEIIGVPMGGGFGGKDDTAAVVCARAALASVLCGRPVKMTYDREWSIRESYKRHPYRMNYMIGLKENRIHAVKVRMIADGGAYCSVTPWVTWRSTVQCCGPYQVANVHCDVFGVHTNNVFTGAFRGFGAPQVNFAVEQWIEDCADAAGMDVIEFRRLNMVKQNCETVTSQKLDNHKVSLEDVMDRAIEISDYRSKIDKISKGDGKEKLYGIGLAVSYRGCSLGAEGMDFCSAIINGQFDGSILLDAGVHENGQGAEAAMVRILADELGVSKDRIRYNRPSTSRIPDGGTTVASRGTLMGGGAVVDAAGKLKAHIAAAFCGDFNCDPEEIRFENDRISDTAGDFSITWEEAMHGMFVKCLYPFAFGLFQAPKVTWDEENGKGNAYFTWGYHCQIAEVEVDVKTGSIRLTGAYAVHDSGKIINREMALGQVYGGFTQGYGMAAMEDVGLTGGRIKNSNLNRYRIPRAVDVPDFMAEFIENADPNSPSGAKGIGEPALEIAAAAVANAVHSATGKRYTSCPIRISGE